METKKTKKIDEIKKEFDEIKKDFAILREAFDKYRTLCEAVADENTRLKREIGILKNRVGEKKP